ncbi:AAA family ATPase [Leptolyngbya sp. FACHB-541]|uniref:AAA family ATPase n=1 Tax=Leptolyngbya sp. FACHB-541 TaxID=2692810 RepID=UPI001684232C|nr:AAA family ATPase [Leptolyngbya sp. FACHB-541]MBD1998123.1 AAA family ATPase [Leptolyngbya sp. FACHB-541]
MIPQQLTLRNFLSYREATLDFRGLHVACICGANGAGKSSLLEAIAWAIWGQSRAIAEDDMIHLGTQEAQVDFVFHCQQQIYRIIRTRYRGQTTALEFQVQTPEGFRALTCKGVRATQQLILQHVKLDYETFVNSAYLRQGRADEFMLKRPGERKQILADLLKLDQYDDLAEQAKERSRQIKAELGLLEQSLERIETQLQTGEWLAVEQANLEATLSQMQQQQEVDANSLQHYTNQQQQRQTWQQQLTLQQQQQRHLTQDCQRLQKDLTTLQQQQQQLELVLTEGEAIAAGYTQFQALQAEEERQTAKFQAHQAAQSQRQKLQQQQAEALNVLKDQLRQVQAKLEALQQQEQEIQHTLSKADDVKAAVEQLNQARLRLSELDQLQVKVAPLLQRRQQVQSQLDRIQTRLSARLEELHSLSRQLETQQQRQPQLQQSVIAVAERIEHLERRRTYQQRVREKGLERRSFLERLQERQRDCELQLAELDHKIQMLRREGVGQLRGEGVAEIEELSFLEELDRRNGHTTPTAPSLLLSQSPPNPQSPFPPCPLCDRPLDEHHLQLVLERHLAEQKEVRDQLWVVREQLAVSEREIQVLRQEYRDLDQELAGYGTALERRGQLQEQLSISADSQIRLQQVMEEKQKIERSLHTDDYATELQEELRLLDQSVQQLHYDDKDHALARGQVDRWRWAEIKQAEIKQAQRRQLQLAQRKPELEAKIAALEGEIQAIPKSPLQQQINRLDRHIAEIAYDLEQHTALRKALRQAQTWQLRYQEWGQAQQHYPQVQQRIGELIATLQSRMQALEAIATQTNTLNSHLTQIPDCTAAMQSLEAQMQHRRAQLDSHLAHLGRLEQQQQQLTLLKQQQQEQQQQCKTLQRQYRVYQELAQAFGKNGIQALMIENVLPQLEAEANRILGRLSANQLHVQFVTQRAGRRKSTSRNPSKLIDTLDILIGDVQGTRPYETYSGGEAFRVNFAIRLALARLLAQRSGTALQMLIIDEGFGTQDEAGCDRLISSIQAIAPDFACILTVTHMPHFKEAFQTRIEVCKTQQGSQVSLLA